MTGHVETVYAVVDYLPIKSQVDAGCCSAAHVVGGRHVALVEEVSAEHLISFGRPVHFWSMNRWAKLFVGVCFPRSQGAESALWIVNSLVRPWIFHFYIGGRALPKQWGRLVVKRVAQKNAASEGCARFPAELFAKRWISSKDACAFQQVCEVWSTFPSLSEVCNPKMALCIALQQPRRTSKLKKQR